MKPSHNLFIPAVASLSIAFSAAAADATYDYLTVDQTTTLNGEVLIENESLKIKGIDTDISDSEQDTAFLHLGTGLVDGGLALKVTDDTSEFTNPTSLWLHDELVFMEFIIAGEGTASYLNRLKFDSDNVLSIYDTTGTSTPIILDPVQGLTLPAGSQITIGNYLVPLVESSATYSVAMGAVENYDDWSGGPEQWVSSASGDYSTAFGGGSAQGRNSFSVGGREKYEEGDYWTVRSQANGDESVALSGGRADGDMSFAMGQADASGFMSFAFGYGGDPNEDTVAVNSYDFAFGHRASASGGHSFSFGSHTGASGGHGVAFGRSSATNAQHGLAVGDSAHALNNHAVSIGEYTMASGVHSAALGSFNYASGNHSFALGNQLDANAYGQMVIGYFNQDIEGADTLADQHRDEDPIFVVGNGLDTNNRRNALYLTKQGDMDIAGAVRIWPQGDIPMLAGASGSQPTTPEVVTAP